jgi:VWFA-related protein
MLYPRVSTHLTRSTVALLLAAAMILSAGAPATVGAQSRPQFRTDVELIQLQVAVVDDDGNFVPGLGVGDFRLRVDGQDRDITTVYEVSVDSPEGVAGGGEMPPAGWRQWILFFDAGFNSPRGVREAQLAAIEFMNNQVQPLDLVGVMTYNAIAGVQLLVPLTADRDQVLEAVSGLGLRQATQNVDSAGFISQLSAGALDAIDAAQDGEPVTAGGGGGIDDDEIQEALQDAIRNIQRLEFEQYVAVADQYSSQIGNLGTILQAIRGRKHVVMFSKGFDDQVLGGQSLNELEDQMVRMTQNVGEAVASAGDSDRFGSSQVRETLNAAVENLRAGDAVFHIIDPSGVGGERDAGLSRGGSSGGTFSESGSRRSALAALADGTGGTVAWDTNDLVSAMRKIEESTRSFYVVAFPRLRDDDALLDIRIDATRSGTEIVSAPTRLAAPPAWDEMSPLQKQAQLAEMIVKDIREGEIAFDVTATPFRGNERVNRMGVVVEIPWEELEGMAGARGDGRVAIEVLSYAIGGDGTIIDLSSRQVGLNIEQMSTTQVAGLPFRLYDLLWAWPGEGTKIRTLVREARLGRLSAVTRRVASPEAASEDPWLSGPVGHDHAHPGLIMRGFDAASPPENKASGPIGYPYMVGDYELTPTARLDAAPGSYVEVFVVINNLGRDPMTGQPSFGSGVMLVSPAGEASMVEGVELLGRVLDEASGSTQLAVRVPIAAGTPSGMYTLRIGVRDQVSGKTIESETEIWIGAEN